MPKYLVEPNKILLDFCNKREKEKTLVKTFHFSWDVSAQFEKIASIDFLGPKKMLV